MCKQGCKKLTENIIADQIKEINKSLPVKVSYYQESGLYKLYINGFQVGEVMSSKEVKKSLSVLKDTIILVEREAV